MKTYSFLRKRTGRLGAVGDLSSVPGAGAFKELEAAGASAVVGSGGGGR